MRTPTPVNRTFLVDCITEIEKTSPCKNRSELHKKVAELYNSKSHKPISHSIVGLRIKEWDIEVKTPKGKKGRQKGQKISRGERKSKSEKFEESKVAQEVLKALSDRTPKNLQHIVEQISNGSRAAAVKLHCLECVGYNYAEMRQCTAKACPLFLFRPSSTEEL